MTPWEWCEKRNAEMLRDDVKWVVQYGRPVLIDNPEWSAEHARWMKDKNEAERAEHLGRVVNPVQGHFEDGDPWERER